MPAGNPGIRSYASAGGKARARRRLTLERVVAELGELETPEDAQRWLRQAYLWAAAGYIAGTTANAMVRAAEVWLKAHDTTKVAGRIRELEQQVAAHDGRRR